MGFADTVLSIKIIFGIYAFAALSAVLLCKKDKAANYVPNILCIIASIIAIYTTIHYVMGSSGRLEIFNIKTAVPLVSFKIIFDGTSAFFILGLSILVLCVSIYSVGYLTHYYNKRNVGLFNFLYSSFILSMFTVFTAGSTLFFFIAWEIMSLVSYFLVVFESEYEENQRAGTLYIIMAYIGTAFLLVAFMIMYVYTGSFDMFSGAGGIPSAARNLVFLLLLVGFGTKAGIIPLHVWLPYAHPAASSNVSALMSGIMIKTAVYGLVRFVLGYLGTGSQWWGIVVIILGVLSCFLGIAYALVEHNIKRLLAYSSIENIGIILIGLGTGMIAYARGNMVLYSLALIAVLFHTVNHAVFKGGLFLGAGSVQYSTHTKDIEELGGLIKSMPYTALYMLCFSLAICAIVPFNGFISEWLTYQSLFMNIGQGSPSISVISIFSAAVLALSGALALACFVKMYGISFLGLPRSSHSKNAGEVPFTMRIGMGLLALLCIIFGLFPSIFLRIIDRVSSDISGSSILNSIQGGFIFVYYPINAENSSVMPVSIFLLIVAVILAITAAARLLGGKLITRKYGTWDCGFKALNSRMQYSATGFSKPLRIVFKILYRPGRELEVEEGRSPYYPASLKYTVSTEKIFEKYLYYPLLGFIRMLSRKLKFSVQTGSVHTYLIYIFITVLVLMLYNSMRLY